MEKSQIIPFKKNRLINMLKQKHIRHEIKPGDNITFTMTNQNQTFSAQCCINITASSSNCIFLVLGQISNCTSTSKERILAYIAEKNATDPTGKFVLHDDNKITCSMYYFYTEPTDFNPERCLFYAEILFHNCNKDDTLKQLLKDNYF